MRGQYFTPSPALDGLVVHEERRRDAHASDQYAGDSGADKLAGLEQHRVDVTRSGYGSLLCEAT